ncbi:MAG: SpoIVB peptidase S55 domain-containing protein [Paraclostridium sp.]
MNFKKFFILSFLVYFFSNSYIYAETLKESNTNYLIPMGSVIQIDAELESLMVRNTIENCPFKIGDSLVSINDTDVETYSDFSNILYSLSSNAPASVKVKRSNTVITFEVDKDNLEKVNFNNLISGFATLTYINPKTKDFAAVAHPINIGCSRKIPIKNGTISSTSSLTIDKSYRGNVGSIAAQKKSTLGKFNINTDFGIKGKIHNLDLSNKKKYHVAKLSEVKEGKASILMQSIDGKVDEYDIYILDVKNQKTPDSKTFRIEIIDDQLLKLTGGIVQGMSGTPIIQDNKVIGAISHAIENNPSLGYGVYIGWMLEGE